MKKLNKVLKLFGKPPIIVKLLILILIFMSMFFIDVFVGSELFSITDIYNSIFSNQKSTIAIIIFEFRIPRAITAILAGSALSVSGLLMQTVFKNPLAGPYVLGISSGASLGVALVILTSGYIGFMPILAGSSIILASWIGSGLVLALILTISTKVKDIMTLLILGMLFGSGISAIVSILQFFSDNYQLKSFVIWSLGSLENVTNNKIIFFAISIVFGLFLATLSIKSLNGLVLGETYAKSMGVNIKTSRILIFAATGILTGTATAYCGPIAFIGIIIPHLVRIIFKTTNHLILIPATIITGAIFLLFSDIVSQMPGLNLKLPINSITALFGIPLIIWLILSNKKIGL